MLIASGAGILRAEENKSSPQFSVGTGDKSVQRLLLESDTYCQMGRYARSFAYDEAILKLDPYNYHASKHKEQIRETLEAQDLEGLWTELWKSSINGSFAYLRWSTLIIPEVNFQSVSVREALEFLQRESDRPDTSPAPEKRIVKIVLESPAKAAPLTDSSPSKIPGLPEGTSNPGTISAPVMRPLDNIRISMKFKNIPLLDAVRYVAYQAGLLVSMRDDGLYVRERRDFCGEPSVYEFDLTPEMLGVSSSSGSQGPAFVNSVVIHHQDPKGWFEAHGIEFPSGCGVSYQPDTRKLIIRHMPESVERIEILLGP